VSAAELVRPSIPVRAYRLIGRFLGRLSVRLLALHLVVVLVPVAGIELARLVERQLLEALERDMRNQATLVRAHLESELMEAEDPSADILAWPENARLLRAAARTTRTRVRLLDAEGRVVADSHEGGPPEGPEEAAPSMIPLPGTESRRREVTPPDEKWPDVPDRVEVREALRGDPSRRTRVRDRDPGVILFLAEPVRSRGQIEGVVYVTRSTQPVLVELYRIRSGLVRVLAVAFLFTAALVLGLAFSVSRPLSRLSRAAKRIASGELHVEVPIGGSGEVRELAVAFAAMKVRLDERHRSVSELAADVAHEFKSPLTSIRGASELLSEGAADDPEARGRFLRNIELDVERLDRLVSRLLLLSRIEAARDPHTRVDFAELAAVVADRSRSVDQDVVVEVKPGARPTVTGREADLEIALGNLVDNALKVAPAGSEVRIVISGGGSSDVRIEVRDSGPGVPPAILPRIFERFFTTDPDRGGTGLGLAIVKAVVEGHGGRVECSSEMGRGTCFAITLPRDP